MTTLDNRPVPSSRIEHTVERELARRRRLLRLYLLLLLVPLGFAAWFLLVGRSDQETFSRLVAKQVAPVEKRYREIAPKLEQVEKLDETLPIVEQATQRLQRQEEQVQALQQKVRSVDREVRTIKTDQDALVRDLEPAAAQASRLAGMEKDLATLRETRPDLREITTKLEREITAKLEQRLDGIEKQQHQVMSDLREVKAKVENQSPGSTDKTDLQKLDDRLHKLEEVIKKIPFKLRTDNKDQQPPGR